MNLLTENCAIQVKSKHYGIFIQIYHQGRDCGSQIYLKNWVR